MVSCSHEQQNNRSSIQRISSYTTIHHQKNVDFLATSASQLTTYIHTYSQSDRQTDRQTNLVLYYLCERAGILTPCLIRMEP
mmetsp:Transcript_3664/g.13095  ORF Transcript_3664/g.13095 Transcript_3664/m.13095 type:complete len:82 (-) Transcript_3664:196-441(-)